jgi:hypothetical protein
MGVENMYKKTNLLMLLTLVFLITAVGCGTKQADPANQANPDLDKQKAYGAVRLAEEKVFIEFQKNKAKDGTPLVDAVTNDKEKAKALLTGYFDPALADKIIAHYWTDKQVDGLTAVNKTPFFPVSILPTTFADVTVEGTKQSMKLTTKDGGLFTVVWSEPDKTFKVSDISKK